MLLDGFGESNIAAFDQRTGALRWKKNRMQFALNYSTPIVRRTKDGGEEIVAIGSGRVIGYDAKTGDERWSREMPNGSIISSPAFADDIVFTQTYSEEVLPSFDDLLKKSDKDGNGVLSRRRVWRGSNLAASLLHSAAWRGLAMALSTGKNGRKFGDGLGSQHSRPSV